MKKEQKRATYGLQIIIKKTQKNEKARTPQKKRKTKGVNSGLPDG
jgi:hypothetical protein